MFTIFKLFSSKFKSNPILVFKPSEIIKLSLHTNLPIKNIIGATNSHSIYHVPLNFISEGLHFILLEKLNTKTNLNTLKWKSLNSKIISLNPKKKLTIGILGKYTELNESLECNPVDKE